MTMTETDEEIRVSVPDGGWCRYCEPLVDGETGEPLPVVEHEHVWKKPKRCGAYFPSVVAGELQCQRDEGHDRGEFPRYAWDHGLNNVAKIILDPTPHIAEWS